MPLKMKERRLWFCFGFILFLGCLTAFAKKEPEKLPQEAEVENQVLAVTGADLIIGDKRISKSTSWVFNFLSPIDLEVRKSNLIRALCRERDVDLLIDPQFSYSKRILGSGKLTVTGYPAVYVNFRNLTENEIDSIILGKNYSDERIYFINKETLK